jgi:adenylate cyclase, class 2
MSNPVIHSHSPNYEVEQKFRLTDPELLSMSLLAIGAIPGETVTQVDTYLRHPARDFAQTDEALRIRQIGNEFRLTYKGPVLDPHIKTRHEIEVDLASSKTAAAGFLTIWQALGFTIAREVRKHRAAWSVLFDGRPVSITIDDVPPLGFFAELEILATAEEREAARDLIFRLAKLLKLDQVERRSYLEMMLEMDAS